MDQNLLAWPLRVEQWGREEGEKRSRLEKRKRLPGEVLTARCERETSNEDIGRSSIQKKKKTRNKRKKKKKRENKKRKKKRKMIRAWAIII